MSYRLTRCMTEVMWRKRVRRVAEQQKREKPSSYRAIKPSFLTFYFTVPARTQRSGNRNRKEFRIQQGNVGTGC